VTIYLAAATSALWFVHPIQITSVLYVVQRMTSLSATFILLGILSYLIGRERLIKRYRYSYLYIFIGPFIFGLIGIFIKETAALLPVFILALEATLYSNEKPWRNWTLLSQRRRKTIIVSAILAGLFIALAIGYWFVISILPGYDGRMFTPKERLLTESRILLFYISLILLPRSNQFGVHHDDIALSSSIFSPWTTLPAVLTLVSAIFLALYIRKRRPLISLGILWFLTGHLLESSIIPLELVHEHRNYLASLGIVIILIQLIYVGSRYIGNNKLLLLLPLLVLVYGSVALSRANQWSSYESLISYNAIHHPRSARAQLELGGMYAQQGRFREAQSAYLAAIKYQPHDPGLLIGLQLIRAHQGLAPDSRVDQLIVSLIHSYPLNATFFRTLRHAAECVQTLCSGINRSLEMWVNTLLNQETADSKRSRYYYYLATSLISQSRTRDAIAAYRKSYDLDRENISALLSLADLYIHLGHLEEAGLTLKYAEKSIETLTQSDRKEITALHNRIKSLGHSKH
jgi:tetratricopeptide (TPR) repeat protein